MLVLVFSSNIDFTPQFTLLSSSGRCSAPVWAVLVPAWVTGYSESANVSVQWRWWIVTMHDKIWSERRYAAVLQEHVYIAVCSFWCQSNSFCRSLVLIPSDCMWSWEGGERGRRWWTTLLTSLGLISLTEVWHFLLLFRDGLLLGCCSISPRCGWGKMKGNSPGNCVFYPPFRSRWKCGCFLLQEAPVPSLPTSFAPEPLAPCPSLKSLLNWVESGGTHAHASLIWWTTVSGSAQKVLTSFHLVHLSWAESERQWKHSSLCSLTGYWAPQRSLSRCRRPASTPHWRLYRLQGFNVQLNVLLISGCAGCVMSLSCSL